MADSDCRKAHDERNLPIDSDIGVDDIQPPEPERAFRVRWLHAGIVALGGMAGTGLRELVGALIPDMGVFPLGILLINISGSLALGILLELLLCSGPNEGHRRTWRLLLGTGFLGGFTTYSALTIGTVLAGVDGNILTAVAYATASAIGGPIAALLGIVGGRSIHRRRRSAVRS